MMGAMKLAYFGDVVGKPGRAAVLDHLPGLRRQLGLDFVIVNGENAAGGFGLTESIASDFFNAGADCLTLGDHAWDQREALTFIEREPRLLRPANYPVAAGAPGKGAPVFVLDDGRRVGVAQLQGNVFMKQQLENAFIPYHEGAIAYFREIGIWTPEAEAKQQDNLNRQRVLMDAWQEYNVSAPQERDEFEAGWLAYREQRLAELGMVTLAETQ